MKLQKEICKECSLLGWNEVDEKDWNERQLVFCSRIAGSPNMYSIHEIPADCEYRLEQLVIGGENEAEKRSM